MRAYVLPDERLRKLAGRFVWLDVDTENPVNRGFVEKFPIVAWPTLLAVDPATEQVVLRWMGTATAGEIETLVKSSAASFLSIDAAKAVKTLAGFADVFVIWQVVLLAIGLTIVGKIRKGQAWTILAVVWGVWILGKVALAAIF